MPSVVYRPARRTQLYLVRDPAIITAGGASVRTACACAGTYNKQKDRRAVKEWGLPAALLAQLLGLGCGTDAIAQAPPAPEEPFSISGAVSALTDYVSRGISQTAGDPAAQGWIEAAYRGEGWRPKFYAGIWASTINLPESDVEADLYVGARGNVGELRYDLGVVRYLYPDAAQGSHYRFTEFAGSFAYPIFFVIVRVGTNYSPDHWGDSGEAFYNFANASVPFELFSHAWSARAQVSRRLIQHNDRFGIPDYDAWSLRIETSYIGLDFALFYSDTDVGERLCPSDRCGPRAVFQIMKRF